MRGLRTRWNRFANARAGTADYFTLTSSHYSLTRVLLPIIERHASGRILDLGAGFGAYRPILERLGEAYVGIDIQPHTGALDVLADGRQLPFDIQPHTGALDVLADGRQLPFADHTFDTVFCSQVLEHTPEPWRLLCEAYRTLCPGGACIVSAPHLSYIHAAPEDYYRYSNYGLAFLLQQAGFRQIETQPAGGLSSLLGGILQSVGLALLPEKPTGLVSAALWINRSLSYVFAAIDSLVDRRKLLALNFVAIAHK